MANTKPATPRSPAVRGTPAARKTAAGPAPVAAAAVPEQEPKKPLKPKLVRDSFTMPQADFDLVAVLKQRALGFQRPAKKSELLRAGLHALAALNDRRLKSALDALQPLKPGRPRRNV